MASTVTQNPLKLATEPIAPPPVQHVTVQDVTGSAATLQWSRVAKTTQYRVEYCTKRMLGWSAWIEAPPSPADTVCVSFLDTPASNEPNTARAIVRGLPEATQVQFRVTAKGSPVTNGTNTTPGVWGAPSTPTGIVTTLTMAADHERLKSKTTQLEEELGATKARLAVAESALTAAGVGTEYRAQLQAKLDEFIKRCGKLRTQVDVQRRKLQEAEATAAAAKAEAQQLAKAAANHEQQLAALNSTVQGQVAEARAAATATATARAKEAEAALVQARAEVADAEARAEQARTQLETEKARLSARVAELEAQLAQAVDTVATLQANHDAVLPCTEQDKKVQRVDDADTVQSVTMSDGDVESKAAFGGGEQGGDTDEVKTARGDDEGSTGDVQRASDTTKEEVKDKAAPVSLQKHCELAFQLACYIGAEASKRPRHMAVGAGLFAWLVIACMNTSTLLCSIVAVGLTMTLVDVGVLFMQRKADGTNTSSASVTTRVDSTQGPKADASTNGEDSACPHAAASRTKDAGTSSGASNGDVPDKAEDTAPPALPKAVLSLLGVATTVLRCVFLRSGQVFLVLFVVMFLKLLTTMNTATQLLFIAMVLAAFFPKMWRARTSAKGAEGETPATTVDSDNIKTVASNPSDGAGAGDAVQSACEQVDGVVDTSAGNNVDGHSTAGQRVCVSP